MDHEKIVKELLEYAYEKMEKNNAYPFCAFVVKNGEIISRGYNKRVNAYGDKTMHGEMEALKNACQVARTGIRLDGCILYGTCEPCLACFDSSLWTGIKQFVFSTSHHDFPEYFNDHPYHIEDFERDNPGVISVIRNVSHKEGLELFNRAKVTYGW